MSSKGEQGRLSGVEFCLWCKTMLTRHNPSRVKNPTPAAAPTPADECLKELRLNLTNAGIDKLPTFYDFVHLLAKRRIIPAKQIDTYRRDHTTAKCELLKELGISNSNDVRFSDQPDVFAAAVVNAFCSDKKWMRSQKIILGEIKVLFTQVSLRFRLYERQLSARLQLEIGKRSEQLE